MTYIVLMSYRQQTTALPARLVYFIDEVAGLVGTSRRTIERRLRARTWTGPAPITSIDKRLRFRRGDVDRWLESERRSA